MSNREQFSERLKFLRKKKKYKRKEFAEMLGIKIQSYYYYESGRIVPCFDMLISIAEKCDVSLDWLCGRTLISDFENKKILQKKMNEPSEEMTGEETSNEVVCVEETTEKDSFANNEVLFGEELGDNEEDELYPLQNIQ